MIALYGQQNTNSCKQTNEYNKIEMAQCIRIRECTILFVVAQHLTKEIYKKK